VPGEVPARVEQFVLQHLRSLEHLDALVAMHREPARWWTAAALADSVGTSVAAAEQILEDLCSANLLGVKVSSTVVYQFSPGSPELQPLVPELIDALRTARVRVYTLITSRAASAVRDFADAFRFKGRRK
jgi:hypothetical protein